MADLSTIKKINTVRADKEASPKEKTQADKAYLSYVKKELGNRLVVSREEGSIERLVVKGTGTSRHSLKEYIDIKKIGQGRRSAATEELANNIRDKVTYYVYKAKAKEKPPSSNLEYEETALQIAVKEQDNMKKSSSSVDDVYGVKAAAVIGGAVVVGTVISGVIIANDRSLEEQSHRENNTEQNHKTKLAEEFINDHGLEEYTSRGKKGELVIDINNMPKKLLKRLAAEQPTSHSDRAAAPKNTNQPTR